MCPVRLSQGVTAHIKRWLGWKRADNRAASSQAGGSRAAALHCRRRHKAALLWDMGTEHFQQEDDADEAGVPQPFVAHLQCPPFTCLLSPSLPLSVLRQRQGTASPVPCRSLRQGHRSVLGFGDLMFASSASPQHSPAPWANKIVPALCQWFLCNTKPRG